MYKEFLAVNHPQWLICHKTQLNQTKSSRISIHLIKTKRMSFVVLFRNEYHKNPLVKYRF